MKEWLVAHTGLQHWFYPATTDDRNELRRTMCDQGLYIWRKNPPPDAGKCRKCLRLEVADACARSAAGMP